MNDLIGQTLGQYQLIEQIGAGGMATVYRAYQPSLERDVAIKVLPPIHAEQPGFSDRFQREARAIANLNHPNILPVHDFGQEEQYSFIVMRYIEGARTLTEVMASPLSLSQTTALIGQIAAALAYAHRRGVIHRDVKPSNVLMDGDWALLTDFGVAKITEASVKLTDTGVGIGTPAYMSPEQGQGRPVDHRADIYALGTILYEMLTGRLPYEADTPLAIVFKRATEPLPPPRTLNPDIPPAVEQVVLKALAVEPDKRFASAGQLAAALEQAVSESGVDPDKVLPHPSPEPPTFLSIKPTVSSQPQAKPTSSPRPSVPTVATPPATSGQSSLSWKWIIGLGGVAVVVIVAILFLSFFLFDGRGAPATVATIAVNLPPAAATPTTAGVLPPPTGPADITPFPTLTPVPPPYGGQIAFVSYRDENAELYIMNVDETLESSEGGQPVRQTFHPRSDWDPAWSPNGRQLVFTSNRYDSSQELYLLSVINEAEGNFNRNVMRLTNHPDNIDNLPAWSPDGKWISFSSYREQNQDIYVLDAADLLQDTGSAKLSRLTIHPDDDLDPTWSPDGARIAFTHVADTNGNGYLDGQDTGEIYVMNADGSDMTRLTDNLANDGGPAWSPDGTRLAFWSTRDANQEIYVMNADGSGQLNLSNHSANDTHPTWSPDGRRLAFVSDRDGNDEIYLMNADGSGQRNLTRNPAQDQDPAWGP